MTELPRADLTQDEGGTLRSERFGDVYFSPDDGLAETRHHFLVGNDLAKRLAQLRTAPFVVGELGFGTGLNVLALMAEAEKHPGCRLHIWTCEGFPLARDRFREVQRAAGERWPELAPYAERLADLYPEPYPGQVQLRLGERVTLTIAFGRVLPSLRSAWFEAEAWFLDGFAPSKNPDMWSPEVMLEVARLTKSRGTAATFSVAGAVRQSLEGAGFTWAKALGFGRKKHMLRAKLEAPPTRSVEKPWFTPPEALQPGPVAIIGAGIAGACLAHQLRLAGRKVVLIDREGIASGASGNPGGLVMPRLDKGDSAAARFYRDAFLYASSFYSEHTSEAFDPCGGQMAMDRQRAEAVMGNGLWPPGALAPDDHGIGVAVAGVLRPAVATRQLAQEALRGEVERISETSDGVLLHLTRGQVVEAAGVVVACGAEDELWEETPIAPSLGQIEVFEGPLPERVYTDGQYVAPLKGHLLTGATYAAHQGGRVQASELNRAENKAAAEQLLGTTVGKHIASRASLRATTPDRHPMAGALYDGSRALEAYAGLAKGLRTTYPPAPYRQGVYVLGGLGSRGLVTAPILAAHLTAQMTGGVSPLTEEQAELVHPGRFLIRGIKRGEHPPL
ncbi:FAD-dependent 5-carboxymethylaminomethyl-2-thiouridine(34) oxidoreductase MnmC [Parvularcula maris]|uniref:tRNA 5-methylaminomethyl-2-thiouridine biosynthesis bifunctional protein MnmC n=1 Tax=Parvularcula maris TaxID=2965077 RepID=A0A9X2RJP9_9PROT|nr:FAD-dependent 5-carboxymethylaminomethyl-2-thiouridine(34) oxidoreductase MnmC [Parvularcula maris]